MQIQITYIRDPLPLSLSLSLSLCTCVCLIVTTSIRCIDRTEPDRLAAVNKHITCTLELTGSKLISIRRLLSLDIVQ